MAIYSLLQVFISNDLNNSPKLVTAATAFALFLLARVVNSAYEPSRFFCSSRPYNIQVFAGGAISCIFTKLHNIAFYD